MVSERSGYATEWLPMDTFKDECAKGLQDVQLSG